MTDGRWRQIVLALGCVVVGAACSERGDDAARGGGCGAVRAE